MLSNWDPFQEMLSMRRAVDRLIDNTVSNEPWNQVSDWALPIDLVEDETSYQVKASIPGVKPEQIEVTYNKGMLTIRGETKDESVSEKGQYHIRERRYGSFTRTISLPATVKADEIQARCEDGILTLKLPKTDEVKPKRIQIQSGGGQKMIDAKTK